MKAWVGDENQWVQTPLNGFIVRLEAQESFGQNETSKIEPLLFEG